MKKKLVSAVLCSAMLATILAGCGGGGEAAPAAAEPAAEAPAAEEAAAEPAAEEEAPAAEAPAASEGGRVIGYTCMDGTNPFFVALEGAIKEVVEAHGDTLISMDPANDSNTQVDQIEDMISRGVDVVFVNPVDADGILPALDMLKDADIPMFGFDTQVGDMSYLVSYAGSDNYNAGYVCGKDLAQKCPEGGDILVLDSPTMQSVTDRTNGFLAALEESGVTFNVVGQQDAQGNQQVANEKATDLLTASPDVVAIFGGNDPTALGAYAAADAAGVSPMIYGVDGSPDIKALLKDTMIEGTGAQSPISIGKTIADTAYQWLDGETVEEFIPIETFLITADNVDEFGTDSWQ
ncbi:MAG: sugar ABC transporter substrate-binding protein [Lachnospiraceae bacterium]|nr:sugar ABC transporter substrate-binding protein [Lachnospiraceae bacterium]